MFAYCNNDPITFADFSGESIIGALKTWGSSMWWLCAADGLVPVGEIVYGLGFIAVTTISWVAGEKITNKTTKTNTKAKSETKENHRTENPRPKKQAYFTVNPYNFKPKRLIRKEYDGTKNGKIIKWFDPVTHKPVFEWNEDFIFGPHYHILIGGRHIGDHIKPNTKVPEPWNSEYFGG